MSEQIGNMMPVVKVTVIESIEDSLAVSPTRGYAIRWKQIQPGATCVYSLENKADWLEDIKSHMAEGDAPTNIMVSLEEMDGAEFHNLPEFEGY